MRSNAIRLALVVLLAVSATYISAGESSNGTGTAGTAATASTGTASATAAPASTAPSLVANHDFENGTGDQPAGWSGSSGIDAFPLDNLTQFWVSRPDGDGKCVKLDTDVYKKEWRKRYDELKADPKAAPWKKTVTKGKKYNTMGGIDGVRIVSENIQINPDATYRITVEIKSTAPKANVFVKGYVELRGRERQVYKARMACEPKEEEVGEWRTYTRTFSPGKTKGTMPTHMRVHIYAYWPPGEVYVDNVLLVEEKEITTDEEKAADDEK
jgi:hypothetical protein